MRPDIFEFHLPTATAAKRAVRRSSEVQERDHEQITTGTRRHGDDTERASWLAAMTRSALGIGTLSARALRGGEVEDLSNTSPSEFPRVCVCEILYLSSPAIGRRPTTLRVVSVPPCLRGGFFVVPTKNPLVPQDDPPDLQREGPRNAEVRPPSRGGVPAAGRRRSDRPPVRPGKK
jgi:hypothetical protein